ncbi:SpoIIE family protein phosphatase [Streptomyces sp. NBC_01142]|uniref:SpoIIE family protein phosphatase n=1 Tax=Streptomyces sp. NBC_01142 TaxID=2975865 RepID=UPI00225C1824|nr:SpoIIE family protein phosphatase [Streptomyces sp. NBC_01142]MCX4821373.1 SpoIIE family protein phosphatase [Streptomyces sp. NBC_01142]
MDIALVDLVRETGASKGMLYVLPPGGDALWLVVMTGAPREIAAPWTRVGLADPIPVADAVLERRLVWVGGMEETARRYPRLSLVLPYDFVLAAAPVICGSTVLGGLVLLWTGAHAPQLSPGERDAVDAGCHRLGRVLQEAADHGDPLPPDRPRILPPAPARVLGPAEAAAAFIERLPGGSCALDLSGRITVITPEAADLVGADAADLLGARPWEALPWMDVPEVEDRYRAALVGQQPTSFTALRPPDTWLSFELYPDSSGISVRIVPSTPAESPPEAESAPAAGPSRATVLYHLMHLATTLTEAVGVKDVVDQTADQLMPALGAQAMALMAPEEGRLKILGYRGYSDALMDRFDAIPLTSDIPPARVLATGVPNFVAGFDDLKAAYPSVAHEDGMASWAFLPLIASGRTIGSLVLAYDRPQLFPSTERAVLTSLAGLIGQALDRARLYDTQYNVARRLQAALLPHTLPDIPGLNVAARYLPAGHGVEVGGDFYDLIRLDDTTVAAAIGDVQGHNIDAAALMGQVRTAVHAHAAVGAPPGDVLSRTNRLLIDLDPGLFTSCLYVHLDLARHAACLASAGHPRPLLRHVDGRTEVLRVPPGLLLGIAPEADYPALEFPLPPGCVLVLYTDGLIEAPGVDPDDAIAALAGLLEHADAGDLDAMADTLIRHAPAPADDIGLLLISFQQTSE